MIVILAYLLKSRARARGEGWHSWKIHSTNYDTAARYPEMKEHFEGCMDWSCRDKW